MVIQRSSSQVTALDTKTPGMIRAESFVDEKNSLREDQTAIIKRSDSSSLRLEYLADNERHTQHRKTLLPLLEAKGITLNEEDQLEYLWGFRPPFLETEDLWLVRHGETPANKMGMRQGVCNGPANNLNKKGREQAANLRYFHNPVEVLIVSPLDRAQFTAIPIVMGELDKGNRVKVSIDRASEQQGYFNWIAHELRQNTAFDYDAETGEFYRIDKSDFPLNVVEVKIDYDFREMSFGAKENESVHGVEASNPSHLMEYNQNAVFKNEEDFVEHYFILGTDGKPQLGEDGKPLMGERRIPSESFGELVLRSYDNIDKINTLYEGKRVGVVGHGLLTKSMLVTRDDALIKKDHQDDHLIFDGVDAKKVPNGESIDLQPAPLVDRVKNTFDHLSHIFHTVDQRIYWG